jgi:hypothetical protein
MNRDETLMVWVIHGGTFLVAGAVLVMFLPILVNGWSSIAGRYEVIGTVEGAPASKMSFTSGEKGTSGSQKFSLNLGDRIVNCSSTQCSALVPGSRVKLSCYDEWHLFVPSEVECRFESLLK